MLPVSDPVRIARFRDSVEMLAPGVESLGVAVSGGPDSLALLVLAATALPARVVAATVDHGLRPAAAGEATMVGEVCSRLNVPHRTLTGRIDKGASVQGQARALRYRLLGEWAGAEALGAIATAHHLDDQAETFLMRAARGAGTGGLSGIRPRLVLADAATPVIRPLLGWRRAELASIVEQAGLTPVDDPSNRDPAHDRTAFRALLASAPLLRPEGIAAAASHLADADEALGWTTARLEAARLAGTNGEIHLRDPADLPRELRRRLVEAAIGRLVPSPVLRGDALDRLIRLLESGRPATLAGVLARPGRDWIFVTAPPRADLGRNRDGSPGASIAINPDRLI
jgi:tRNA(Ile)-lysidine synthase